MKTYDYFEERMKLQSGGELPKDINKFIRDHYADLPLVLKALDFAEKGLNSGGSIKVIRKIGVGAGSTSEASNLLLSMLLRLDDMPTSYGMVQHVDKYEVFEDDKCIVIMSKRVVNKSVSFKNKEKKVKHGN